ncbi:MAG: hypothetical protein IJN82_06135 [Clostridia bacterium]|nr:hypothetical protein [Clostridia bacterium]MBQ7090678.1 hypothetical protein [Clostridia bacterium]
MPILYVNLNKQESLTKEPYASFLKRYDIIKENVNGEQIDLRVGGKDGCFTNGFYVDKMYCKNPRLRLEFATLPSPERSGETCTFVRAIYSYEGEDGYDLDFHLQRARDIKKRAPYYYIPGASHFEFSSQVDDEFKLIFDVLVEEKRFVSEVCCSLISLLITIFSLED